MGWLILKHVISVESDYEGHGDQAFTYFMENAPSAQNDRAEIRKLEPYCYGQFTEGKDSPHFGRSHVHWLTGTASTVMVGCVEGILGMRPDFEGLRIAPSIPADWDQFTIEKDFRGKHLHIVVENRAMDDKQLCVPSKEGWIIWKKNRKNLETLTSDAIQTVYKYIGCIYHEDSVVRE